MPVITIATRIKAPVTRVFDLARSAEAHIATTAETSEASVSGKSSGLLEVGDEMTWTGKHLGFQQTLTIVISEMSRPDLFVHVMKEGAFRSMTHRHAFEPDGENTIMRDEFDYVSRRGLLGKALDNIFLTAYLRSFLSGRNKELKRIAESDDWKKFLPEAEVS